MNAANAARLVADAFAVLIAGLIVVRAWPRAAARRGLAGITLERIQLFFVTLLIAGWYAVRVLAWQGSAVPPVNNFCLWVFAVSCILYAAIKAARTFGWI